MNFHIPQQATFFYRGKWNQEMDSQLLLTLINLRSDHDWEDGNVPDEVLNNVRAMINHPFGAELSSDDISARVKMLEARYSLFKKVVGTNGVQWNMEERVVIADELTWKIILETDASAAAYFYRDEPEFNLLARFFGWYDIKVEFPHEVITLSDNTKVIVLTESLVLDAPIRGKPYDSPADSDEVTSPMPGPSTRVRHKLFDVGVPCVDAISSTTSTTRVNPGKKGIFSSPKGSSCAPWSPCPSSHRTLP
ncbi:hypothetical protein SASPL_152576 [Salvia splendens]|uniref:Myb/SANT-like domain-containing protein n=1 Tax=Salvia splendens TaxID=180675 RepID=A0A8X8Z123_SALSN|nr:uncharacterized protein LOC121784539 [Salvia splendens]KAG6387389.1 hypothetical protein SASPL_152576 [Salvia splendens]